MSQPVIVAVTSDHHTNSTLGLMPPEGVKLDEGNPVLPNKPQLWSWEKWLEYHEGINSLRRKHKAKLVYVSNGDACDGNHHGTTQIITANEESQAYIVQRVFGVVKGLKPDEIYVVRGTTAHVGEGASTEEALAKWLGANRDPESDAWSTWHLRLHIHGRELDFQHHCSVGGLPWTRSGGLARLAYKHMCERQDAGTKPADVIIRSHKHVHGDSYDMHRTRAIVTPAWQFKTAFAHKVATESIADIGGIAIVIHPDGQYEVKKWLFQPSLPQPRVIA